MNYKNIFKRETKVIAYVVICLTLVVIGTSYALFLQVNNNSNNQVVTAGSLTITYSGGNTVTVDDTSDSNCLLPQSDSEGIGTSGCVFNLSVTNTGTLPMQYNLLIYNNESDAPSGATFVDHTYIRHSLKKQFTVANKSETVTSAAALGELSTYNSTNKKILETAVIEAGETITFALNIWIDENASTEIIGQYVYLKLDVVGTVYEQETATQALLSSMGENGIAEVMSETSNLSTETTSKEYRYTGATPKNYIYYNCEDDSDIATCETWRILGIYNVENNGEIESRIKLVSVDSELNLAWDENAGTTYNTSTINSYLNNDYYNSLSTTARNQIENASYKLGGADALNIDSKEMYNNELASEESISTKVALMNLSDYTFASGLNNGTLLENISSQNENNWLFKGSNEWLLNKNSDGKVYTLSTEGKITTADTTEEKLVRPVVYLASNIKIVSGDGSEASPYVLSK